MSAEFDFKAAFHKEHDDLCKVEARHYVLEQRIKTLGIHLRAVLNITDEYVLACPVEVGDKLRFARKALGEEIDETP